MRQRLQCADKRRCRIVAMELKEDFESLAKDVQEYLKRSLDNTKLTLVEELSLMIGNALATMIVTMMLFVALLFILAAMVALLSEVVGFVLAMLIAGMNIVRSGLLQGLKRKRLYVTAAMKCFIAPLVTLLVLALLPVDAILRMTLLIASACPTGANGIMFAGKYNGDSKVASHMFALTTLCSIISIPVVIYIGTLLIK